MQGRRPPRTICPTDWAPQQAPRLPAAAPRAQPQSIHSKESPLALWLWLSMSARAYALQSVGSASVQPVLARPDAALVTPANPQAHLVRPRGKRYAQQDQT